MWRLGCVAQRRPGKTNGGPVRRVPTKTPHVPEPPLPVQAARRCAVTTVTTVITVAAGAFAPGHLGELTRVIPFELADAVLEEGGLEKRVRLLPSRCGLYFPLAMCLFPESSYQGSGAS